MASDLWELEGKKKALRLCLISYVSRIRLGKKRVFYPVKKGINLMGYGDVHNSSSLSLIC